jgi:uncharacterized protein (DUF1778 family)
MAIRTERIESRVGVGEADRIRLASKLTSTPVSRFVSDAATEKAERIIVESQVTRVSPQYFEELLAALDAQPRPIAALIHAATRVKDAPAFKQVG